MVIDRPAGTFSVATCRPGALEAGIVSCVSRGVLDTGAWFNCKVYEEQVFSDLAQEACAKAKVK